MKNLLEKISILKIIGYISFFITALFSLSFISHAELIQFDTEDEINQKGIYLIRPKDGFYKEPQTFSLKVDFPYDYVRVLYKDNNGKQIDIKFQEKEKIAFDLDNDYEVFFVVSAKDGNRYNGHFENRCFDYKPPEIIFVQSLKYVRVKVYDTDSGIRDLYVNGERVDISNAREKDYNPKEMLQDELYITIDYDKFPDETQKIVVEVEDYVGNRSNPKEFSIPKPGDESQEKTAWDNYSDEDSTDESSTGFNLNENDLTNSSEQKKVESGQGYVSKDQVVEDNEENLPQNRTKGILCLILIIILVVGGIVWGFYKKK